MSNIFQKIGGFFKALFTKEQVWEKVASTTLMVIAPLLETALTLMGGPALSTEAAAIIAEIQAGLKAVNDVVTTAGPAPDALTYLQSVQTNLKELLTTADVKNSANYNAIELIITTLDSEIQAIIEELPSSALPQASTVAK